jgi:Spy/CpxP family protein refolding chaperone
MRGGLFVLLILWFSPVAVIAQSGHDQHTGHGQEAAAGYGALMERQVKALSDEEVRALLGGEGAGFALTAELNGIPGPLHILELAEPLELTPEQRSAIEEIFGAMRAETTRLGEALVELERTLDRRFVHRHIDPEVIRDLTGRIGALQGEIRAVHLIAHLEVDPLLTDEQQARYQALRGYVAPEPQFF